MKFLQKFNQIYKKFMIPNFKIYMNFKFIFVNENLKTMKIFLTMNLKIIIRVINIIIIFILFI